MSDARQEVKQAARNTWSQIAPDWLEAFEKGEEDMTAAQMAEAVFDADRITTFNDLSPEALEYLKGMSWPKDMVAMCKGMA